MHEVKFAFIGCGKIAERHADAILAIPAARIVAVCDRDQARAAHLAAFAKAAAYHDYDAMLEKEMIDVVVLMTPSGLHYAQSIDIIKRYQKHLVIEKPLVLSMQDGENLEQLARQHAVTIYPIYQNRFNKAVARTKSALSSGELGALHLCNVSVRWCREQRYYDQSPWRGTWAMDGGALTNQGIHFIDLLRYLGGEIKRVHAKTATLGVQVEVEDTAVAIIEFESGALGTLEIITSARPHDFDATITCIAANGMAEIAGIATNELRVFTPNHDEEKLSSEAFVNGYGFGHNTIYANIVAHQLQQAKQLITLDDGLKTIQLLHAFYLSDETDSWVEIESGIYSNRLGVVMSCSVEKNMLN